MTIECCECKTSMGYKAGVGVSHGICVPCLRKKSPGAYFMGRRREIQQRLEAFDRLPGSEAMNGYFWSRRPA